MNSVSTFKLSRDARLTIYLVIWSIGLIEESRGFSLKKNGQIFSYLPMIFTAYNMLKNLKEIFYS